MFLTESVEEVLEAIFGAFVEGPAAQVSAVLSLLAPAREKHAHSLALAWKRLRSLTCKL